MASLSFRNDSTVIQVSTTLIYQMACSLIIYLIWFDKTGVKLIHGSVDAQPMVPFYSLQIYGEKTESTPICIDKVM